MKFPGYPKILASFRRKTCPQAQKSKISKNKIMSPGIYPRTKINKKLQSSEVGRFCLLLPIFAHFKHTLEGCSVWSKKDMKNLNTYSKSAKFKNSEKYELKYFSQVEKSSFFLLHFSFSFSSFLKIFDVLYSSTQNYLLNEVLL